MAKKIVFILSIFTFVLPSIAQKSDTLSLVSDSVFIETNQEIETFQEQSKLDPDRAVLLSAVLPGLGQIYNKQYWKVPIIVSGFVVFGHLIDYNNRGYHAMRNALILDLQGKPYAFSERIKSQDDLIRLRDRFRRNRDYMMILGTVFYLLQVVDAHVSAHLDEFNVNDKLSLRVSPSVNQTSFYTRNVGLSLTFSLK